MPEITPELREAIERRRRGQVPRTSPIEQTTRPSGALPTGGPNVPIAQPPQTPPGDMKAVQEGGQATIQDRLAKEAGAVQGEGFDDETRKISKALVKKLIEVL